MCGSKTLLAAYLTESLLFNKYHKVAVRNGVSRQKIPQSLLVFLVITVDGVLGSRANMICLA